MKSKSVFRIYPTLNRSFLLLIFQENRFKVAFLMQKKYPAISRIFSTFNRFKSNYL